MRRRRQCSGRGPAEQRSRLAYRRRRDRLVTTLARRAPLVRVTGIPAGLHALVQLPAGQDEGAAVDRATERDLAVEGLSSYHGGGPRPAPALVVGYATPPDHAYTAALGRLAAALAA